MTEPLTTHFITLFRGPTRALLVCQRCSERIETTSDVWVPEHECGEGK